MGGYSASNCEDHKQRSAQPRKVFDRSLQERSAYARIDRATRRQSRQVRVRPLGQEYRDK